MCDHTAVAKAIVVAQRTLAIALLTIGMGVNSTWAESDQASGSKFTPMSSEVVVRPVIAASHPHRSITMPRTAVSAPIATSLKTLVAQACLPIGYACSNDPDCCSEICSTDVRNPAPGTVCICIPSQSPAPCTTDAQCCGAAIGSCHLNHCL
jgi:hypothetical protein